MAKPKLALIPATQGSKLYSVLPADGVGDFTFSRGSAATRINKDGLIETVAVGKSRLNYPLIDGKVVGCPSHLLEPQRTNNVFYSQEVDNAYWLKSNCAITSNTSISPDGTLNADTLTITSGASGVVYKTGINVGSLSFFAKDINLGTATFTISVDGVGSASWDKNGLLTSYGGGIATNGEYYGNGWYRFVFTVTSGTVVNYGISSGTVTNSILVFGLQNEPSSTFQTSYIPTTSSAVTRVADDSESVGLQNVVNSSEGVFYFNTKALSATEDYRISLSDGSANNRVSFSYSPNVNTAYCLVQLGGAQVLYNLSVPLTNQTEYKKFAIKWKSGDLAFWVDGAELISSNGVFTAGTIDRLRFNDASGGIGFKAAVKDVRVYSTILTDTDLETITSWTSFTDLANGKLYSIK